MMKAVFNFIQQRALEVYLHCISVGSLSIAVLIFVKSW